MSIQNIYELLGLDGQDFIREAYCNLLKREPDEHGMAYYLGRLAAGYSKANIIMNLADSKESCPHDEINGLGQLIRSEKYRNNWLIGLFCRRQQHEKLFREGILALVHVNQRMGEVHSTLRLLPLQLDALAVRMENLQTSSICNQTPVKPTLSTDDVCAAFREILGRDPENDQVIAVHANFDSIEDLRKVLLDSEEFKSRVSALPEYARSIFNRMQVLQQGT
jgi:hypothetical protein